MELVEAVGTLGRALAARVGIITGEAAVSLGTTNRGLVAGDLVNTASRLQSVAEVRAAAEEARQTFTRLGTTPFLLRLEAALSGAPTSTAARAEALAGTEQIA